MYKCAHREQDKNPLRAAKSQTAMGNPVSLVTRTSRKQPLYLLLAITEQCPVIDVATQSFKSLDGQNSSAILASGAAATL